VTQRTLAIIAAILGALFVISLIFLILFGVRLSEASSVKSKEVAASLQKQEKQLKSDFQKERETVLVTYKADEIFGSFSFTYPKVWSTNIKQEKGAKQELIFLADPNLIVENRDTSGPYPALRVEAYITGFETMVKDMRSKYVTRTKSPYKEEDTTVSGIKGKKYSGLNTDSKKNVSFIILPLRDKTLYIGTDDSDKYTKNLETITKSFVLSK
jgi:hypothetical protein